MYISVCYIRIAIKVIWERLNFHRSAYIQKVWTNTEYSKNHQLSPLTFVCSAEKKKYFDIISYKFVNFLSIKTCWFLEVFCRLNRNHGHKCCEWFLGSVLYWTRSCTEPHILSSGLDVQKLWNIVFMKRNKKSTFHIIFRSPWA